HLAFLSLVLLKFINHLIIKIHLPYYTFNLTAFKSNLYSRIDIFRVGIKATNADFALNSFAITYFVTRKSKN
ncbi:MAG: hypothetical protein ACKO96_29415, partial [Flammeovirgaceae bacterium]